eukprot:6179042-Pleurochrysis_carterae.AAC.3
MHFPASARSAPCRLRPSALPPPSLSSSTDPRLVLREMVSGENIAPSRPHAGSTTIVHARSEKCYRLRSHVVRK